jgi:hypothetical protein
MLTKTIASLPVHDWTGKPIKMPGIYRGIPLDAYHGNICVEPSISSSGLRRLYSPLPWVKASPAHYWCHSIYNPDREEEAEEQRKSLILGRAAHHLLFGEKAFREVFSVRPATINGVECNRKTTQGKLWHKQQAELHKTVITMDGLNTIKKMAASLAREPLIVDPGGKRSGILNGYIEHSWFFKHKTGVWVKIRPDATPNDSLDFVDLKTTKSVMWSDLQRSIRDYGYWMQAGLVAMAVQALIGQPLSSFSFVFVETTAPYLVDIVTLKENEIKRGIDACELALSMFVKCWKENRWPGPRGDRADAEYIEMNDRDQERIDEAIAAGRKATN